jgi:hypothetical protein
MDDLNALARLTARIEQLERRVSVLEHPAELTVAVSAEITPAASLPPAGEMTAQDSGIFPLLGKAMLGIAGAYLLRAVADSGSFPKMAVVILALAYAGMWLVLAARVPLQARLASAVYATTAALILAPMVWELTLRFEVLTTSASATILGAFVITAYALAWKHALVSVVWVANLAAAITALGLIIATHDLAPFVNVLLLMALASEVAACRNRWLSLRPFVAIASDLAAWVLFYIYSRPEGIPPEYTNIATPILLLSGCALSVIYGACAVFRTTRLREKISFFEIGQAVLAFLLAAFSVVRFGGSVGATLFGGFCLLLAAMSSGVAYAHFDLLTEQRNYHVFATWSASLFIAGLSLGLSRLPMTLCLSTAAIGAMILGVRTSHLTLQFHGLAYLASAAYVSGLLYYAGRAVAGTFPAVPGWIVWIVASSAVACYAVGGRSGVEPWKQRFLQLLSAILAVAAVLTFLVSVLVWLAAIGMTLGAPQVAIIRTLITCSIALVLSFSGSRWQRVELVWIAYCALALVTAKLLFEDLQHGHPASTAVSIFLYAVALILVPRMVRIGRQVGAT